MTTIKDIIDYCERFAPLSNAMDFDNVGLLVGDENTTVTKVIVTLDITPEVVTEAKSCGANLIISHHPVIFNPLKRLETNSVPYLLARENISALCLHTNLDLGENFGVNICLANALGLQNIEKYFSRNDEVCMVIGGISFDAPVSMKDFAKFVKDKLCCEGLRYTDSDEKIIKVAVSSGAGGSEIYLAKNLGANVLVTGEIKHNQIIDANNMGLSIIDAGHFKTEDVVILPLAKMLGEKFKEVDFTKSICFEDKIKYI